MARGARAQSGRSCHRSLHANSNRGREATVRVRRDFPHVKVLALTVHEERDYITQLLKAGASGYVLKRSPPEDIVKALRTIAGGDTYMDPLVSSTIVNAYLDGESNSESTAGALSGREKTVLMRLAEGFSNKEIAAELGISVKTVETYRARVATKLGIRSRVEIIRYVTSQGWLARE